MTEIAAGTIFSTAVQGMRKAEGKAADAAGRLASGEIEARHVVDLKQAETAHKANGAVVRTADRMHDRLLDLLA